MDSRKKNEDVSWMEERLSDEKARLRKIETMDYYGVNEEQKEEIAAEYSMCVAAIWVLEEMIESRQ